MTEMNGLLSSIFFNCVSKWTASVGSRLQVRCLGTDDRSRKLYRLENDTGPHKDLVRAVARFRFDLRAKTFGLAGLNQAVGTKGPSDSQLQRAGFTKYVKGNKGYEKAFGGPDTPNLVPRD